MIYRLVVVGLLALTIGTTAAAERPNVVLITVDDMNWDSVGVFGSPIPNITPHIDRLAREGMRFERAHVTIAICQPTRAVWMTGRYPHRSGALGFDRIRRGVPTLVEALSEAGYYTGLMAKVPHVVPSRRHAWNEIVKGTELGFGRDPIRYYRRAKEFFDRAAQSGKPFFLMANAQDPHRPFAGSDQERRRWKNPMTRPVARKTFSPSEIPVPGFLPDLPQVRQEMAEYFASVHRADETVGAVLRALDESGRADQTLVMFLSDHGMPLPFAKTNCYYHSTRTPWIVRYPSVTRAGSVDRDHFISGVDLAATVLDAVGLPPLEGCDGTSFLPLLRGESQKGRDRVFTYINTTAAKRSYPMRAVQDARYGYIWNGWSDGKTTFHNESQSGRTMAAMRRAAKKDPAIAARVDLFLHRVPEELYDYQSDPDALHNLANDPKYRDELERYRRILLDHMKQTNDPQLTAFQAYLAER